MRVLQATTTTELTIITDVQVSVRIDTEIFVNENIVK